jgi:hypothetical protein
MRADKNSSPKKEPGLYPEFTTKDSHTSLPRSRSHSGPTNPRNKPQTIPKRKHDSKSKGLSYPRTNPRNPRNKPWRTVRYPRADGLLIATERPDEHPTTRTVRTWSSDGPRATRAARTVCDLWADGPALMRTVRDSYTDGPTNPFRPEPDGQTNRNEDAQGHTTNTRNTRQKKFCADCSGLQTDCPPGLNRAARAPNREHNYQCFRPATYQGEYPR